jgi:IS1 family transposase
MTGAAKGTVLKLLADLGQACERFHDETVRGLRCNRIQCDEIWSFCYAKEKNVPLDRKGRFGFGDVWTWTAIDADSKMVVSWLVGDRDLDHAIKFINDLSTRVCHRIQLTTDGHQAYLEAVEGAFGSEIDYAMLQKLYAAPPPEGATRYSPARCCGTRRETVMGHPDPAHVSTSYVERQNLTIRMSMRRFTRLTNAFSKKVENLRYAVALHFVWYNFGRVHQTLRVTPAMQAGLAASVWSVEQLVNTMLPN